MTGPRRPRNDLRQYDDLAGEWWRPEGAFAALHWLAAARGRVLPAAPPGGALLVDLACGAGLMAPHAAGYTHVGVDLSLSALSQARTAGLVVASADITALPLPDEVADVVIAGEILEHVADLPSAVAETARILKPGGLVIVDTVAANLLAKLVVGYIQERLPGGPPRHIHDPRLFVAPARLRALFDRHGVSLRAHGLRVHPLDYLRFLVDRRRPVRLVEARRPLLLYQGIGWKRGDGPPADTRSPVRGARIEER